MPGVFVIGSALLLWLLVKWCYGTPEAFAAQVTAPDITFLDVEAGRVGVFGMGLIGDLVTPIQRFVAPFKPREAVARSSRLATAEDYLTTLPDLYLRHLLDFTAGEKQAIAAVIRSNEGLAGRTWRFMKMGSAMEFGRTFIFGDVIVMTVSDCEAFVSRTSDRGNNLALLTRYSVYLEQFQKPKTLESAFLGLRSPEVGREDEPLWTKARSLRVPKAVRETMYTDPNTVGRFWIFASGGQHYWPGLFIDRDFGLVQLAYRAQSLGSGVYRIPAGQKGKDLASFAELFGEARVFYHPACQVAGSPMGLNLDLLMKLRGGQAGG